jgi:hypothetical protein
MRAQKYVILPDEDGAEFAELEAALVEELAPVGALQTVLARRVAVAAWRLARADRIETELFEERRIASGGLGLALIRDGNGPRSFETLLRYRGAALAEFWRALRTLKALQAELALEAEQARASATGSALAAHRERPAARPPLLHRPQPNEPERDALHRLDSLSTERPDPRSGPHESPATWRPNEPESGPERRRPRRSRPESTKPVVLGAPPIPAEPTASAGPSVSATPAAALRARPASGRPPSRRS